MNRLKYGSPLRCSSFAASPGLAMSATAWLRGATTPMALVLALLTLAPLAHAQLTGTRNVPGDYATLEAAITDLNAVGVGAGGVILNLVAANPQTAPAGGYTINLAASNATAANPVTLRGNGNTITASAAHVAGALTDAIFKVIGEDHVTIENFAMQENAANIVAVAATNTMTEWGVAVLYRSMTDGAQNITIQNNTISLGNNPPTLGYSNTFGIYASSRHSATAPSTAAENTTAAGAHNNLRIFSNQISRVNMGIAVIGTLTGTGMATGLDIGGASAATGNSITDFGLAGPVSTYQSVSGTVNGVLLNNQLNFRVAYNTITSNNGQVTAATLRGVFVQSTGTLPTFIASTRTISNNTISLRSGSATSAIAGIVDEGGNVATTLIINDNEFTNTTHTVASSGTITFIGKTTGGPQATTINGNRFTNLSVNSTGSVTLIDNSVSRPAGGTITVNNNQIVGAFAKIGAGGTFRCYNNFATSPATVTEINTGNSCTNITLTGATAADLWRSADGATPGSRKTITGNTFGNVVGGASTINGLWVGFSDLNFNNTVVSGNTISNISAAAQINGILSDGQNQNFTENLIHTLATSGATAVVNGILISGGVNQVVARNRIYNLENTGAGGAVAGIAVTSTTTGATTFAIQNNLIGDLRAPNSTAANALYGINFAPTSATAIGDISYNTVLLAATTTTGGPFGSSALFVSTTPTVIVRNNVLVNRSTPAGAAQSVAHRRTTSGLTTYGAGSGNNLYWAGTPGPANLIYADGTNSDQLIADFRTRVADRDNVSVSNDPSFLSTSGASADFLRPDPAVPTPIESGAVPIAGLSVDFANQPRNAVSPDIGAWEIVGTTLDLAPPSIRYTPFTATSSIVDRALPVVITDAGGVAGGGVAPRIYYRKGAAGPYVSVACTGGAPNFVCTIGYAAVGGVISGDQIQYFVIAQDASGNLSALPGAGLVATDVTNVTTAPSLPASYIINAPLPAAVNVGTGETLTSLTNAGGLFAAINAGVMTQDVTVTITTDLTAETGAVALNQAVEEGAGAGSYRLRIQPAGARVVSGTVGGAALSLIDFNGADRVTIDGLNAAGASLTIRNSSVGTTSTVRYVNDAINNTLTNVIVESGTSGTMVNVGVGSVTGNDGFRLTNSILRGTSPTAVPFNGFGSTAVLGNPLNSDVQVLGNTFTDFSQAGVFVNVGTENIRVTGNTMQQSADRGTSQFGIAVNGSFGTLNEFSGNTVTAMRPTTTFSATGINVNGTTQAVIANNRIFGFAPAAGATGQIQGIVWGGSATFPASVRVVNNYISLAPAASNVQTIIGLFDAGFVGNDFVADYNSIFIGGTAAAGASSSFALIRVSRATNHTTRNNIAFNNRSGGTGAHVARSDQAAGAGSFVSNHNFYAGTGAPTAANLFENGVGNFVPFAGWQAGPPARDANATSNIASSLTLAGYFVDATAGNLNLLPTAVGAVNAGTPIAGITTDIAGTMRLNPPDIGAFELASGVLTITPSSISFSNQLVGSTSAAQTVTLGNTGNVSVTVNPLTAATAPFALSGGTCSAPPITIGAGATCTLTYTFSPTATGPAAQSLTVTSSGEGSGTIALSGTGIQGSLVIAPTALDFGNTLVGSSSAEQSVTLSNSGTASLNVTALSAAAAPFERTASGSCATTLPITLAAGTNCTLSYRFSPTATGAANQILTVTANAPGSGTIGLAGTGVQGNLTIAPGSVAFGNINVGSSSAEQSVTLSNTGTASLNVTTVTAAAAPFERTASGTCAATLPITLAAGANCTLSYRYSPTATGAASQTLTVMANAPGGGTIALSGNGVSGALSLTPNPVAFGNVLVGATSSPLTATLTNTGTGTLSVTALPAPAAPFARTGGSCAAVPFSLNAGENCTLTYTFSPTATGAATGSVAVVSSPGGTNALQLTGTGTQGNLVLPANVNFGAQPVGSTSNPVTVTLANSGTASLEISALSTAATPFARSGGSCAAMLPFSIAPGANCTLIYTFSPTAVGPASQAISVSANAPGGGSFTLSGTGAPSADLAITKTSSLNLVNVGLIQYSIVVSNTGPNAAPTATVVDTFPAGLANIAWTCVGIGGGSCTANGSGNINRQVNLPSGATVVFSVTAQITAAVVGDSISNTATVSSPVADPNTANNSATVTNGIWLFKDGFELPPAIAAQTALELAAVGIAQRVELPTNALSGLALGTDPVEALRFGIGADRVVIQARQLGAFTQLRTVLLTARGTWAVSDWRDLGASGVDFEWTLQTQGLEVALRGR